MDSCKFFEACGGCLYLDLSDDEYHKIKIAKLHEAFVDGRIDDKISPKNIEFFWVGAKSRRKITLQVDAKNNIGFFAKATKNLVEIDNCYVADEEISALIPTLKNFLKSFENNLFTQIVITKFDNIIEIVFDGKRELNFAQSQKIINWSQANKVNTSLRFKNHTSLIFATTIARLNFSHNIILDLNSDIFIQATKQGLEKITATICNFIENNFAKKITIADIYAGFGAYSFGLAHLAKKIYAFEGAQEMVHLIEKNAAKNSLSSKIETKMRDLILHPISKKELEDFDLAIINPPRNGAAPQAEKIAQSNLKHLIYVSCNPQSFARDAKILLDSGFVIDKLVVIDQFYSSSHLELVAILSKK